jgi:hypothetical protein
MRKAHCLVTERRTARMRTVVVESMRMQTTAARLTYGRCGIPHLHGHIKDNEGRPVSPAADRSGGYSVAFARPTGGFSALAAAVVQLACELRLLRERPPAWLAGAPQAGGDSGPLCWSLLLVDSARPDAKDRLPWRVLLRFPVDYPAAPPAVEVDGAPGPRPGHSTRRVLAAYCSKFGPTCRPGDFRAARRPQLGRT